MVCIGLNERSGPRQARTVDPRIKSPLLYRLSYRPHVNNWRSLLPLESALVNALFLYGPVNNAQVVANKLNHEVHVPL